jgi:hypothetical protein
LGGELRLLSDDVCFVDARDLEIDLAASPRIRALVRDTGFAVRLYAALCNICWHRDGYCWHTSWRSSGRIVANLRGSTGKMAYCEFYCFFGHYEFTSTVAEGSVADEVAEELARLGWTWHERGCEQELDRDLSKSDRITELVKNREFALRLYRALSGIVWIRNTRRWQVGKFEAASIVTRLRSGDNLANYWGSGGEGTVAADVAAELAAIGWTQRTEPLGSRGREG